MYLKSKVKTKHWEVVIWSLIVKSYDIIGCTYTVYIDESCYIVDVQ